MKKTIGMIAMLLLLVGMVTAAPFSVEKTVTVEGDWVWDNGWTQPSIKPVTAEYTFNAISPLATIASYSETESLGTPWKYSLDMLIGANSAGSTRSAFSTFTVNDPETTPATGGYTQYGLFSNSIGAFSETSLKITGEGNTNIVVNTEFDSAFTQFNQIRVNELSE